MKHCYPAPLQLALSFKPETKWYGLPRNAGMDWSGTVVWFGLDRWYGLPRNGGLVWPGIRICVQKFDFSLPKTPIIKPKLCFLSLDQRYGEAYPRDVVAGVATTRPRTAPCREKTGSQGGGTYAPCTCSQGGLHLTKTSFCAAGRPNKRGPWHGRSRPPAAAVQVE